MAEVRGLDHGPQIVFLHGWGTSRQSLRDLAYLFQHTHRVHLLDLPGFGDAPPPPHDWGTPQYAALVQRYLASRVQGPFLLVGHSFGGRLTVRVAAAGSPGPRGIVLIGVPGLPQPPFSRKRLRRLWIRWLRKAAWAAEPIAGRRFLDWHTQRYASRDYRNAGAMREVFVRTVNEDLSDLAPRITCPALLLWGTHDDEAPTWLAEKYKSLMDGRATLKLLPHKDHFPFNGTGAHLCAFKIREWLRTLPDA